MVNKLDCVITARNGTFADRRTASCNLRQRCSSLAAAAVSATCLANTACWFDFSDDERRGSQCPWTLEGRETQPQLSVNFSSLRFTPSSSSRSNSLSRCTTVLLLARLMVQYCFAGCRLSSSVTLPAGGPAGLVDGRAADTARRASRVTSR